MRADNAYALCLDQTYHHSQNSVIAPLEQGSHDGGNCQQHTQRRMDVAPFRPAAHPARQHRPADSVPAKSRSDAGIIPDGDDLVIEIRPVVTGLIAQCEDVGRFAPCARRLGNVTGQKTATCDDGKPVTDIGPAFCHAGQPLLPRCGEERARSLSAAMKSRICVTGTLPA